MSVLRHSLTFVVVIAFATLGISVEAFAQAAPKVSGADTAWVITATALVLFMTMPGLALFYGAIAQRALRPYALRRDMLLDVGSVAGGRLQSRLR